MKRYNGMYCLAAILVIFFSLVDRCFYGELWWIVFLCYNACLIFTVRWAKQNARRIAAYFPAAVLIVYAVLYFVLPMDIVAVKMNWQYYLDKRQEVIELVEKSEEGSVQTSDFMLESVHSAVSNGGEIVIYQNQKDAVMIGFWYQRGLLNAGSSMLVYVKPDEESELRKFLHTINQVSKIDENWYYAAVE